MTDITKLREYLEERKRELEDQQHNAVVALSEINDALVVLDGDVPEFVEHPISPSPPSPKPPREACADAIMEHYAGKVDEIPYSELDLPLAIRDKWRVPKTRRAALAIARTRREGAAVLQMPKAAEA
jgi:hypothetical protein